MTRNRNPDPPDEPEVTSMRLQDLPAYREMASSEAFKNVKAAKVTPAPRIRIQQRWTVDCDACGTAVEPEQGPFKSREEADQAKQQHLEEHARGEWA